MIITETIHSIKTRLDTARAASPLASAAITLLGASKGQSQAAIEQAIEGGLTCFGENRVQEAESRWPAIKARHPDIQLHLIGPLQTNKAKQALALFDVIQTIDSAHLADALAKAYGPECATKEFFIQVNTGEEPQKAGVTPKEAGKLIEHCRALMLPLTGLMCIPPADQPPAPHFAFLRELARSHGLMELSMGMSDDYEVAARMGSTLVRVGRALFGERT